MQKQTRSQVDNEKSCCKALISCNIYNKAPGVQSATRCQPPLQTHGGERDTVLGIHKICWIKCSAGQGGLVPAEEAGKRGAKPHATPPPKERAILGRGGGERGGKSTSASLSTGQVGLCPEFWGPLGPAVPGTSRLGGFRGAETDWVARREPQPLPQRYMAGQRSQRPSSLQAQYSPWYT